MKESQLNRVEKQLKAQGFTSRNYWLDVPYNKITRLSDIIMKLRAKGYDITTDTTTDPRDTIYRIKEKRIETYRIPETGEVYQKKIYA